MTTGVAAIALTGTIGAGKTSLAEALSVELHGRGIRHALIDLDWLGQVYPTPKGHHPYAYELALQNLKQVWPNFQSAGADKAIVAGTLLDRDQRDRLRDALGGLGLYVVLVEAPQEVLEARIRNRNSGALLNDFLARTSQVAEDIATSNIHDFRIENHGRAPQEIALELLEKVGWVDTK